MCRSLLSQFSAVVWSHKGAVLAGTVVSAPKASFFLVFFTAISWCYPAEGVKLPDIYWNSSNPIFRIDNTDHIIDVNKGNQLFDFDQIDLICPSYPETAPTDEMESYMIYLVTRPEYETCALSSDSALRRPLAKCDGKAGQSLKYTITFRSFTPQPGGHEFRPGHDYFLISTSTGGRSGLMQQKGGACKHQNMRITFKICCRTRQPPNSEEDEAQHGTVPAPANASDRNATGLSKQLKSDERFSWETRQNLRLAENSVDTRNETKIDALTLTKTLAYGRRPQERSQSDHTTVKNRLLLLPSYELNGDQLRSSSQASGASSVISIESLLGRIILWFTVNPVIWVVLWRGFL